MKKKHILLIDDNETDNFISNYFVEKSKIAEKITVKGSALEAMEYLEKLKGNSEEFPDFIFLDLSMPKMDGFDFLDQFMKFPEAINNKCSVAILTSSNDKEDIARASQYPVVKKYFIKPLRLEDLNNLC